MSKKKKIQTNKQKKDDLFCTALKLVISCFHIQRGREKITLSPVLSSVYSVYCIRMWTHDYFLQNFAVFQLNVCVCVCLGKNKHFITDKHLYPSVPQLCQQNAPTSIICIASLPPSFPPSYFSMCKYLRNMCSTFKKWGTVNTIRTVREQRDLGKKRRRNIKAHWSCLTTYTCLSTCKFLTCHV